MSANDSQNAESKIQKTPELSPVSSGGTKSRFKPAPKPPREFSIAIPLAILLVTLIFSTGRDMVALNKRMTAINNENAPALEILRKASKGNQRAFIDSLKAGITKLTLTDPIAAQIGREFFPIKPPSAQSDAASAKDAVPPEPDWTDRRK